MCIVLADMFLENCPGLSFSPPAPSAGTGAAGPPASPTPPPPGLHNWRFFDPLHRDTKDLASTDDIILYLLQNRLNPNVRQLVHLAKRWTKEWFPAKLESPLNGISVTLFVFRYLWELVGGAGGGGAGCGIDVSSAEGGGGVGTGEPPSTEETDGPQDSSPQFSSPIGRGELGGGILRERRLQGWLTKADYENRLADLARTPRLRERRLVVDQGRLRYDERSDTSETTMSESGGEGVGRRTPSEDGGTEDKCVMGASTPIEALGCAMGVQEVGSARRRMILDRSGVESAEFVLELFFGFMRFFVQEAEEVGADFSFAFPGAGGGGGRGGFFTCVSWCRRRRR